MTKTLYDPEVERQGYEKGEKQGYEKGKLQSEVEIILNMYSEGLNEKQISKLTKIDSKRVQEIIKNYIN